MTGVQVRRVVAGTVAAMLVAVTGAATRVTDDQLLGEWWPWLWGATTAAMIVASVRADSRVAWWPAGGLLAAVTATRIPAVVGNSGDLYPSGTATFGVAWYGLTIALIAVTWWLASDVP